jgi:hypothetical protein
MNKILNTLSVLILLVTLSLFSAAEAKDVFSLPIEEMISLNGNSKQDIYNVRKACVMRYPELAPANYKPSEAVFGQIVDGKPWWGMLGLCYYGAGEQSIEGPSRESQFILNPYILMGLKISRVVKLSGLGLLEPRIYYPVPKSLVWNKKEKVAVMTYEVADFLDYQRQIGMSEKDTKHMNLNTYNARDLGYPYYCIESEHSENVSGPGVDRVTSNIQYIHCGGSCGHSGGCNNQSPYQAESEFDISTLPARAVLKLWKKLPASAADNADMTFVIEMI